MGYLRDKTIEEERLQFEYRKKHNPSWKEQLLEHYDTLYIDGPVKVGAREIIKRALKMEGFEMKKKRKRLG